MVYLNDLVVLLGDTVLETVVLSHDLAKELWIESVDDIEHELTVTLANWIIWEVVAQEE